jgi:hypothetical protein
MTAMAQDFWVEQCDEPAISIDGRIDPRTQDAYWQGVHWSEPYFRAGLDYEEDYAPAYLVGYVGYAQYGGSFDDAEKCLCANWVRIKGSSRLTLDEAMQAIRAAWNHAEQSQLEVDGDDEDLVQIDPVTIPARQQRQPAFATA